VVAEVVRGVSPARIAFVAVVALFVVVLIFPGIYTAIRDVLAPLFSKEGARVIGVIAGLITIAWQTLPPLVKAIRGRGGHTTEIRTTQPEVSGTRTTHPEVDAVRADARNVARRLQRFMADRRAGSPIRNYPGLELPREGTPEREKLDAEDDTYDKETFRLYGDELHDEVVRVRDAFADLGITDPELENLYPRPTTYTKLDAIAARLIAMADRR
jgi:hypothetical protein